MAESTSFRSRSGFDERISCLIESTPEMTFWLRGRRWLNWDRQLILSFQFRLRAQFGPEKDADQRKHDNHKQCCDEVHDGSRDSFVLHAAWFAHGVLLIGLDDLSGQTWECDYKSFLFVLAHNMLPGWRRIVTSTGSVDHQSLIL